MPISGGVYSLPPEAFPINNTVIDPADYTAVLQDVSAAINTTFFRDGSNSPTSDINWNGQALSNVDKITAASADIAGAVKAGGVIFPYGSFIDNSITPVVRDSLNYLELRVDSWIPAAFSNTGSKLRGAKVDISASAASSPGILNIFDTDGTAAPVPTKYTTLRTGGLTAAGGQILDINNLANYGRLLGNNTISAVFEANSFSSRPLAENINGNVGWWMTQTAVITQRGAPYLSFQNNASDAAIMQHFNFYRANPGVTFCGSISTQSGVTSYNTSSDKRLKTVVKPLAEGLATICGLEMWEYIWKDTGLAGKGGLAQDMFPVVPEAVTVGEGLDKPWSVDYSKIVPHLIVAIQELTAQVNALKRAQ